MAVRSGESAATARPPQSPDRQLRILGLDAYVERNEIDGVALLEKYPAPEYVLG